MNNNASSNKNDPSEFLLEEYRTLREFGQSTVTTRESRLNFYLAIISGGFVGLTLLWQQSGSSNITSFISGVVFIGIFYIGVTTFQNTIKSNFQVVQYQRGQSRIRHYFLKRYETIEPYLYFSVNDDKPIFRTRFPSMTATINSMVAGTGISLFINSVFLLNLTWICVVGIAVFLVVYLLQRIYFIKKAGEVENFSSIHFPSNQETN